MRSHIAALRFCSLQPDSFETSCPFVIQDVCWLLNPEEAV